LALAASIRKEKGATMGCGYPKNVSINVKKEKKNGSFTFELM